MKKIFIALLLIISLSLSSCTVKPSGGLGNGDDSDVNSPSGDNGGNNDSGEPSLPTIAMVLDAEIGSSHTTMGVVVGVNAQSFLIADSTGKILVYMGSTWTVNVKVGDVVKIESAVTSLYGGAVQFGAATTYTVIGETAVTHPSPVVLSPAELDAYLSMTSVSPLYVKVSGTLEVSGNYFNVVFEGAETVGSISYPIDKAALTALDGNKITVEGYVTGVSGGRYLNILAHKVSLYTSDSEHNHEFVDGKCSCGEFDPDYTPVTPPDSGDCTAHTDTNKDEKCDNCNISVVIILDFYALNDLHGKFDDTDDCYGVDELTTYLKNANNTDDHTILLSSGDMWQGSSESNLTKGMIITEWMNELGFVSMTIGNHEFDWGSEYIVQNGEFAEFAILAINIYDISTGKLADYCQPSVVVERDGIKIGIIGAIGDVKSSISASYVEDVEFKTGTALVNLVKAESERLRAEGCEFIVYSVHEDKSGYSSVLSNGYVDLVFEGHSHSSYVYTDSYGIYHLQNGANDDGISHVEIKLNWANDTYSINVAEIVDKYDYSHLSDDPIVDALLEKYKEQISLSQKELGYNDSYRDSDYITDLVAKLYVEAGLERWGETYNIVLGGGYLKLRDPYYLSSGLVIYSDLMSILPFDNDIVLCSIKGDKLKSNFINTTNSAYHIAYSEYGNSIKSSIDLGATYYVIVDKYTSDYAKNGLTVVDTYTPGVYARDLVADYIMEGGLGAPLEKDPPDGGSTGDGGEVSLPTIDMVLSSAIGSTQSTMGVVVGLNAQSFLLQDETGIILVYNGSGWNPNVSIGDVVVVESGTVSTHGNSVQFGKGSTYSVVGSETVASPTPSELSAAELDAYATKAEITPIYVKVTGVISVSGSYYNLDINDATITGSITYPINSSEIKALNGKTVVVEGYITSCSSGKYLNLLALNVKEA